MEVQDLAKLIDLGKDNSRSVSKWLRDADYEAPLLSDAPLPLGLATHCEKSRAMTDHTDYLLSEAANAETEVAFGGLKSRIDSMIAPYDGGTSPVYASGPPGLGKTTLAYAVANVVAQKTSNRVAVFHINGALEGNSNLLAKRVTASPLVETVTNYAMLGAMHPVTMDFLNQPHDTIPEIKRFQSISTLPDQQFSDLVGLMHRHDLWPVSPDRSEWDKELVAYPQLTPLGASLLPQYGLDEDRQPVVKDNLVCFLIFDEITQSEDQKSTAAVVGAFSPNTARTGNPYPSGFPSGWINQLTSSGQYNRHRFLFAAGNDPGISGGDSAPMDALASRLFTSTLSMPRSMQIQSLTRIMACNMLGRVTRKDDPFKCATPDSIAKHPEDFEVRSPILRGSAATLKNLLTSIAHFEAHVRESLVSNTAAADASVLPTYLEEVRDYNQKYAELGWGNVLNMRNMVNLAQNLAKLRMDGTKAVNEKVLTHEVVKSFLGARAASHIGDDERIKKFLTTQLPDGASLLKSIEGHCASIEASKRITDAKKSLNIPAKAFAVNDLFVKILPKREIERYTKELENRNPDLFAVLNTNKDSVDSIDARTLKSGAMVVRVRAKNDKVADDVAKHAPDFSNLTKEDVAAVNAWMIHGDLTRQTSNANWDVGTNDFKLNVIQKDSAGQLAHQEVTIRLASLKMMLLKGAATTAFPPPVEDIEAIMLQSETPFPASPVKKTFLAEAKSDIAVLPSQKAQVV